MTIKLKEFTEKYGNKEVEEAKLKELLGIKDSKLFIPKIGERYLYVGEFGNVHDLIRDWNIAHDKLLKHNIVCRTEEEAEFAREAQAFKVKMKRDFAENSGEIDWGDRNQAKYRIFYNYNISAIDYEPSFAHHHGGVFYTTDEEWLEQYIEDNEADIKKYVFEIKEGEQFD